MCLRSLHLLLSAGAAPVAALNVLEVLDVSTPATIRLPPRAQAAVLVTGSQTDDVVLKRLCTGPGDGCAVGREQCGGQWCAELPPEAFGTDTSGSPTQAPVNAAMTRG